MPAGLRKSLPRLSWPGWTDAHQARKIAAATRPIGQRYGRIRARSGNRCGGAGWEGLIGSRDAHVLLRLGRPGNKTRQTRPGPAPILRSSWAARVPAPGIDPLSEAWLSREVFPGRV